MKEDVRLSALSNGIQLVTQKRNTGKVVFIVTALCGSMDEPDDKVGLSHASEHMMFKGTPTRSAFDISREAEECGGDINAFTSFEITGYHFSAPINNVPRLIEVYADSLHNSLFSQEEWAKEKEVILQEWRMGDESNTGSVNYLLMQAMFGPQGLVIGTPETIKAITPIDIKVLHAQYYKPERLYISVAGGLSHKQARSLAEKYFGAFEGIPTNTILTKPGIPSLVPRYVEKLGTFNQTGFAIGFKTYPLTDPRIPAIDILSTILGTGMSSRLFNEVREKRGLVYSVFSTWFGMTRSGVFYIGGYTEKPQEAYACIMEELDRIVRDKVSDSELEKAKTMIAADIETRESSFSFAEGNIENLIFYKRLRSSEEQVSYFRAVTKDDVRAVAEDILQKQNMTVAVTGPVSLRDIVEK